MGVVPTGLLSVVFFFVVRPFLFDPDPIGTLSLLVGFGRLCFVVHVISSCLLHTVDS